ncbi:hypothetical protein R1sor_020299 [Riccia sorocarpa]|uniref:ADF-H domain-containing protein n=1 Tax=Riccia sorocarpa TaxID=122646 RepID=A0ABD3IHR3_9MARC
MANATSGMAVDDQCKLTFQDLKRKKAFRFIIFKIDETAQKIVVEKTGGPEQTYDDFSKCMPENDCRPKMMYASSRDRFKRELDGIHYELQATDPTEMDINVIKEKAN